MILITIFKALHPKRPCETLFFYLMLFFWPAFLYFLNAIIIEYGDQWSSSLFKYARSDINIVSAPVPFQFQFVQDYMKLVCTLVVNTTNFLHFIAWLSSAASWHQHLIRMRFVHTGARSAEEVVLYWRSMCLSMDHWCISFIWQDLLWIGLGDGENTSTALQFWQQRQQSPWQLRMLKYHLILTHKSVGFCSSNKLSNLSACGWRNYKTNRVLQFR